MWISKWFPLRFQILTWPSLWIVPRLWVSFSACTKELTVTALLNLVTTSALISGSIYMEIPHLQLPWASNRRVRSILYWLQNSLDPCLSLFILIPLCCSCSCSLFPYSTTIGTSNQSQLTVIKTGFLVFSRSAAHNLFWFRLSFLTAPQGLWDLSSPMRDEPMCPAVPSLNHWVTREVPIFISYVKQFLFLCHILCIFILHLYFFFKDLSSNFRKCK